MQPAQDRDVGGGVRVFVRFAAFLTAKMARDSSSKSRCWRRRTTPASRRRTAGDDGVIGSVDRWNDMHSHPGTGCRRSATMTAMAPNGEDATARCDRRRAVYIAMTTVRRRFSAIISATVTCSATAVRMEATTAVRTLRRRVAAVCTTIRPTSTDNNASRTAGTTEMVNRLSRTADRAAA